MGSGGAAVGDERFSEVKVEQLVRLEKESLPREPEKRQIRPWWVPMFAGTGLGVAIAFGGMSVFSQRPASQEGAVGAKTAQKANPVMTVTIASPENTSVTRILNTTGTIAARDLIPVLPQTNGLQIKTIPEDVKEGVFVNKGQVLAVLDNSILQAQISQARADVQSKQADVQSKQADVQSKQADVNSSQAIVKQKQADLAQTQAKLEEAQKNFQRYQKLATAGAISEQELDTRSYTVKTATEVVHLAQENIRSAQANVISAKANIDSAKADVNKSQADVRSSAAKLQQLQTQLGQTVVRAPVSGIIAEKLARVGDVTGTPPQSQSGTVIGGTQKLFSIIGDGKLELQAQVPENQLSQVKVGATVQITSDISNRVRLQGRVREIQPQVNDQRREATVKIDLPPNNLLKSGMFARAAITTKTTLGMSVPQKAVQSQPDGSAILFTLSGEDIVRSQKVEVGELINGNRIEIKSGLQLGDGLRPAGGERIVVDGAGYLKDGDKVRVASP